MTDTIFSLHPCIANAVNWLVWFKKKELGKRECIEQPLASVRKQTASESKALKSRTNKKDPNITYPSLKSAQQGIIGCVLDQQQGGGTAEQATCTHHSLGACLKSRRRWLKS